MGLPEPRHEPVLLGTLLELLAPRSGDRVLDLTVGLAGHAKALLRAVGPDGQLLGIDVDPVNLELARPRLAEVRATFQLLQGNFAQLHGTSLGPHHLGRFHRLLADLGLSSNQLEDPQRGFSFQHDGPLDMRLDPTARTTAADLVNRLSERQLSDLIYHNSQERFSRRIAKHLCQARRHRRITRTSDLVRVICQALRVDPNSHAERIHPATRTFLALRIAVNDELAALRNLLQQAPHLLEPGGRFAVISFHSLEDRLVKDDFRTRHRQGVYHIITRKPVTPDPSERARNPRCRSAKIRVVERTDQPIVS